MDIRTQALAAGKPSKVCGYRKAYAELELGRKAMEKREACIGMKRRLEEAFAGENPGKPWKEADLRDFRAAVEILSAGSNTVIADDWGLPSVMVRISACRNRDLLEKGTETLHPAFYSNGEPLEEIYISKFQNVLINGRGYSLPMRTPAYGLNFEQALQACRSKGAGWNLTPYALRAALALEARRKGFFPHGNSDNGVDYFNREEYGQPGEGGVVRTGSGPVTWSHNNARDGIYDLTGNLNEWDAGLRLVDGEIQIIPKGLWMKEGCTIGTDCQYWRSILPGGELAEPGAPNALRYVCDGEGILLTTAGEKRKETMGNCAFGSIRAEEGMEIPELLYAMMLYPEQESGYDGWRWIKSEGECLPLCGGGYRALDHAGIFFVGLTYPRTHSYNLTGFRSIYIK